MYEVIDCDAFILPDLLPDPSPRYVINKSLTHGSTWVINSYVTMVTAVGAD